MADHRPGEFTERRKYRHYALELISSDKTVQADLEFIRSSEEGARISIMPPGIKDVWHSIKFIVKNKAFHKIDYASEAVSPESYRDVPNLIEHMNSILASTSPMMGQGAGAAGEKPAGPKSLNFQKPATSADGKSYHIFSKVGGGQSLVDSKFKIKPNDGSNNA